MLPTIITAGEGRAGPAAQAGAPGFAAFYDTHVRAVVGLAYSLTADWALAEEIAQDAFVQAYVRWRRVQAHPRPDLWVRRVALNRATSQFRRRAAERRATARSRSRAEADARSAAPPYDGTSDWLIDLVRALPRQQAHAVALVHLQQLTHEEAASVLGCAPSTLRTHLLRARQALQRAIEIEEQTHAR